MLAGKKELRRMIAKIKNISYEETVFEDIHLTSQENYLLQSMLERYHNGEPLSKILNCRAFWEHDFFINGDVLDPRPETEILIEMILERFDRQSEINFLDIGTGSGCILLSLLQEYKNAHGTGIDVSSSAINVAKHNQKKFGIENANFIECDWKDFFCDEKIDVIVSNPPYIRSCDISSLDENVRSYDPLLALDGGESGLDAYFSIAQLAKRWLKPNGCIFLEVGYDQMSSVSSILQSNNFKIFEIKKDYSDINRGIGAIL
ncbi:MAG: peptide chain release factor N(5)-glutamine methyltransferase [Holosporaceae bacterium]|jgi:release factor glutamine methyltransferase|nr:peptide chain release factor N(5)-glutamine methyltransferase [Holosporaceae bacterium]